MSNHKESVRGRLLLLAMPAFILLLFTPIIVTNIQNGITVFDIFMLSIFMAAAVMGVCFFFPEQTVLAFIGWRHRRTRFRVGALNRDDAHRLAKKYTPTPVPPNRYGNAFEVALAGMIYTRVTPSEVTGDPGDPRLGRAVVRWLRRRRDPVLLLDALVADMSAAEMEAHLNGRSPFDPETIAMLAGLQPHRKPDEYSEPA